MMGLQTVQVNKMQVLTAQNISAPHCFTTRFGGVSRGYLESLNIGTHRGDQEENVRENYRRVCAFLGADPKGLVLTHQTHTDIVLEVGKAQWGAGLDQQALPECDGLVTNTPGTTLVVFTADCTPILLHDPVTGAVGAVHAGWRGTVGQIAARAVEKMQALYGADPKNIRAAIGPNIGMCCFETDEDVPIAVRQVFGSAADPFITKKGEKYYLDLKQINALALQNAGVTHIDIATECTKCQCDRFWSHRVTGTNRGSQGALIVCKEAEE